MSTINTSQNNISSQSTTRAESQHRTAPSSSTPSNNVNSTNSRGDDQVNISREAREKSGFEGASLSLLDGLKDNFANANSVAEAQGGSKSEAQTSEQKIDGLKATLDSFKGLKGEELKAKLDELKKSDPELAAYLEKLLAKDDKNAAEAGKEDKAAEAKPAEKTKSGGDDGAPSETFLWKPTSDSDGKLVILLPSSVSAQSVSISGPSGSETVEKGGRNGSRGNGQREHYRFSQSGEKMKGPVQVTVALENGGSKTININNPAQRNEGGSLKDN